MYNATAVCYFGDLTEPMEKSVKLDGIGGCHYKNYLNHEADDGESAVVKAHFHSRKISRDRKVSENIIVKS